MRSPLAALVTTYNEADTIGPLVHDLLQVCDSVLVVDDPATTDDTERVAHDAGADTLVDSDAHGIGPCLLAGLRYLEGHWVVVIDAGGSHSPVSILPMCQRDGDVVIGSRFLPGSRYVGRPHRARLSRVYAKACNRRTGQRITDWTSGFRRYSPDAVRAVLARPPAAKMHGFQPQALAACLAAGCSVVEYPITYRAGRTSMSPQVAREAIRVWRGLSCS